MADINKFTVVYADTASANKSGVKIWGGGEAAPTLDTTLRIKGVTLTDSDYEEPVAVMKRGYIRSVTPGGTPSAGDLLWAQADGSVSKTKPTPATPLVFIGTYLGGNVVDVDVMILPSMSELSHVKIETPVEFDVMIWDPAEYAFVPRKIDHGADLAGLADDDHVRYFDKDGTKDMTGPIVAVAGTKGVPGITFVGDEDTGLFSSTGVRFSHDAQEVVRIYRSAGDRYLEVIDNDGNEWLRFRKGEASTGFISVGGTTPRALDIGTANAISMYFRTSNTIRWQMDPDGHLLPQTDIVTNVGAAAKSTDSMYARAYRGQVIHGIGFSSGEYNVGSSDDELANYSYTIPADTLRTPGDFLLIEGAFVMATNANQKTLRLQLDATTKRVAAQTSVSLANMIVRIQTKLYYRTSTTGSWGGVAWIDASGVTPISGQGYLTNAGLTGADWTSAQVLSLWAQGGASNDIRATDYNVTAFLCTAGSLV